VAGCFAVVRDVVRAAGCFAVVRDVVRAAGCFAVVRDVFCAVVREVRAGRDADLADGLAAVLDVLAGTRSLLLPGSR
jgi:hypothetical protein